MLRWHRLRLKATVLKDPTTADALANLIPASKAEEALVKKAGSKVRQLFSDDCCTLLKLSAVNRVESVTLGCFEHLCCAVLCCAVLCCAVLCCAVLCCTVLCCASEALVGLSFKA